MAGWANVYRRRDDNGRSSGLFVLSDVLRCHRFEQMHFGDARVEYRPKNENVGYIFVPCHCFCFRCRWSDEACLAIKARLW